MAGYTRNSLINSDFVRSLNVQPTANMRYQGCDAEEIKGEGIALHLPRTVYHLFFVFFSLQNYVTGQMHRYPILERRINLLNAEDLGKNLDQQVVLDIGNTEKVLGNDIRDYFKLNAKIAVESDLQWGQMVALIYSIWNHIEFLFLKFCEQVGINGKYGKTPLGRLVKNFSNCISAEARYLVLQATAAEWVRGKDVTLLFRSGHLDYDNVKMPDHGHMCGHCMSFDIGIFQGLCGGDNIASPLYLQITSKPRDLYALALNEEMLRKHFFCVQVLRSGLASLVATGAFSQPRLKVFLPKNGEPVLGLDRNVALVANKIKDLWVESSDDEKTYFENVKQIFNSRVVLISDN
jgi:hypothetical protein